MEKGRHVDKDEALKYTASVSGTHHLTSAKSGAGVSEAFTELLKRIHARKKKARGGGGGGGGGSQRATVSIVDEVAPPKKGGCC
jgi:hypothetical protein